MIHHWHVLGAGSMGCLFAAGLVATGCEVSLLLRPPRPASRGEVTLESVEGNKSYPVILDDSRGSDPISHLLVATKANDISAAIEGLVPRLAAGAPIVIAANGMGYLEPIEQLLPQNPVYCCLSTDGAYRIETLHVRHAGRGRNLVGSPAGLLQPAWLENWTGGLLEVDWEPDINGARWHKLAINCAINPLTALHRCPNGQLARDSALRTQVALLCDEICAISAAAGFPRTAASLHRDVSAVIANTANNRSSMLQDVLAQRETEIDFITGYLLRTAERLQLDAPLNRKLLREVTRLG